MERPQPEHSPAQASLEAHPTLGSGADGIPYVCNGPPAKDHRAWGQGDVWVPLQGALHEHMGYCLVDARAGGKEETTHAKRDTPTRATAVGRTSCAQCVRGVALWPALPCTGRQQAPPCCWGSLACPRPCPRPVQGVSQGGRVCSQVSIMDGFTSF